MNVQEQTDYSRVAQAINFINTQFQSQPTLEQIAESVSMSPFHFQRLFTEWAGVSPKKFLQYITVSHAKRMLKDNAATLFDTAIETGLSGTGRLHDLFISIEGMTPGEYKNGGESLAINYSLAESPFGKILIASTHKGICHIAFADDAEDAVQVVRARFPKAMFTQVVDLMQQKALSIFNNDWSEINQVKLHLKGTAFQVKVWESLLKIPMGRLVTYGSIAKQISLPNASRAVGTAIGDNPIAFLIPCHRVIQSTGIIGGYHWGTTRKKAIIGWEASQTNVYE